MTVASKSLEENIIFVAVVPFLTRLERLDDRVLGLAEVLRRVIILRSHTVAVETLRLGARRANH